MVHEIVFLRLMISIIVAKTLMVPTFADELSSMDEVYARWIYIDILAFHPSLPKNTTTNTNKQSLKTFGNESALK